MGAVIELDKDIEVIVEAPQSIEVTVESQEVGTSEFNSDSALGMLSSAIITLQNLLKNLEYDLTGVAQEKTLEGGVNEILSKIKGVSDAIAEIDLSKIDLSKVEQSIGEVKDAVANIDFSEIAKESSLNTSVEQIINAINSIEIPQVEIDTTALAKETTLNAAKEEIIEAVGNAKVEIDLSSIAKQGENPDATNTAIYELLLPQVKKAYSVRFEKNDDNINTYTMVLPLVAGIEGTTIIL